MFTLRNLHFFVILTLLWVFFFNDNAISRNRIAQFSHLGAHGLDVLHHAAVERSIEAECVNLVLLDKMDALDY